MFNISPRHSKETSNADDTFVMIFQGAIDIDESLRRLEETRILEGGNVNSIAGNQSMISSE